MTEYWTAEQLRAYQAKQKRGGKRARHEHREQAAVVTWANEPEQLERWPELEYLYAIPNGGHRRKSVAARLKAEGVQSGVPDLKLPVARQGYHGLYIEMKYGRNKPTDNQRRWIRFLRRQGYRVEVCYGAEAAKQVIVNYMEENDAKSH